MCFGGGGPNGAAEQEARRKEEERQANIASGSAAIDRQFLPFDDAFFNRTRDAYRSYATPQLDRQVNDARDQLEFGLSRAGLSRSTVGAKQRGDFDFDVGTQRQSVADRAQEAANTQRGNVATARQSIVGQLNADANAGAAASNAAARAAVLSQQPTFSPIGELFGSVTKNLSLAAQGEGLVPAGGSAVTGSGSGSPRLFQRVR